MSDYASNTYDFSSASDFTTSSDYTPRDSPPSLDQLPLLPRRYHNTTLLSHICASQTVDMSLDTQSIYLISPPQAIRDMLSTSNTRLRATHPFGATLHRFVAMDCALAGWKVDAVKLGSQHGSDKQMVQRCEKLWEEDEGGMWGGYERMGEWGYHCEGRLGVTGNLQAWMEHLTDTETIEEWGPGGYLGELRVANEEDSDKEKEVERRDGVAGGVAVVICLYVMYLGVVAFYYWVRAWVGWFVSFLV